MGELLEQINSPDDLKTLSTVQLKVLAEEIREFILGSVSKAGGHLASNLGVVELTLALHYVFDFKTDKLLWDVGHQCYAHKIITGRKHGFNKFRQADGISGFPNPAESLYDQFAVGHAGTSIATAIGMALGEQLKTEDKSQSTNRIVALVGDASIVNGVSFEGLNNLGLVKRQLLILLNDNSMAIDATQGAVAKYFSRVRLSQTYEDLRKTSKNILDHLPVIGKGVDQAVERIKKSIRMALPPSQLFESLNIPYFGPVDGHDVGALIHLLRALVHLDRPAILHVYTKKGKGFSPAEQDRRAFHSTGPFKKNGDVIEPVSTVSERRKRTFTDVFGEYLVKLAQEDDKIVAITSAMCDGTGLGEFRKNFSKRFYDVGIAESAAVDIAAGLAKCGFKPVVCIYSTFLQRCFDQIFQEVALQNLPVIFCVDRSGVVGADGPTHHGMMDIGFLRMMPNIVLTAPASEIELKLALEFALRENKPVVIRYPKDLIPTKEFDTDVIGTCAEPFELGKSVVVREHKDSVIAIVAYGCILIEAVEAARLLAEDGIEVDVINARFAVPLDESRLVDILLGSGKGIITVEDHSFSCGFGSAVLESVSAALTKGISKPIAILGASKSFIKHNSRDAQLMQSGVNADNIAKTAKQMLNKLKTGKRSKS